MLHYKPIHRRLIDLYLMKKIIRYKNHNIELHLKL